MIQDRFESHVLSLYKTQSCTVLKNIISLKCSKIEIIYEISYHNKLSTQFQLECGSQF